MRWRIVLVLLGLTIGTIGLSGPPPASAIFNGNDVSWQDHSEVAQLEFKNKNGDWSNICGATFLSNEWALTAAHCVVKDPPQCESAPLGWPRFGDKSCYLYGFEAGYHWLDYPAKDVSRVRVASANGKKLAVSEIIVHPAFQQVVHAEAPSFRVAPCGHLCSRVDDLSLLAYDTALVKLSQPAIGVAHVKLLDDPATLMPGLSLTAYGWGDTDPLHDETGEAYDASDVLKASKAGALQLSDPLAYPACAPSAAQSFGTQRSVLCASSTNDASGMPRDAGIGQGDSGGPWFTMDTAGNRVQVGVTSFVQWGGNPSLEYATKALPNGLASVPAAVRWIRSITGIAPSTGSSADNVATALVIDNSGSMSSNDRQRLRLDASNSYINAAVPGDYIGAVGFEDYAYELAEAQQMPAGADALKQALSNGIYNGGGTNIGAALNRACEMLDDSTLSKNRAAILLTDGDGSYNGQASCFADRGWKVYTIGLGNSVNKGLLQQIADETGGTYQPVPTASELQCKFQQVRAAIAGGQSVPCQSDLIQLGETITKTVAVAARLSQVTFATNWPGSDVVMSLTSPSGRQIARDNADWDVTHSVAGTHEEYVIAVPEQGEWTVELYGADVDPQGEEVVFTDSQVPFDNDLPTVEASVVQVEGDSSSFLFSATASDPDGDVESILWNFGNGQGAAGASTTYRYPEPGTYEPSVTAVDDLGEATTHTLPAVTVAGPSTPSPEPKFSVDIEGLSVTVDASTSSGDIETYFWDFDGDSEPDVTSSTPTATWSYADSGEHTVSLGVLTTGGISAMTSVMVTLLDTPAPTATATVSVPETTPVPSASYNPQDLYEQPGFHNVNGRTWFTTCEPYSQTTRCRTDIWGTRINYVNGKFVQSNGWQFNNLTYLPFMKRSEWTTNPLGHVGQWTDGEGRDWRTECDTAVTGGNGCRSYTESHVVEATARPGGGWSYAVTQKWVFNNIVRFQP